MGLPDEAQRAHILSLLLADEELAQPRDEMCAAIAAHTVGYRYSFLYLLLSYYKNFKKIYKYNFSPQDLYRRFSFIYKNKGVTGGKIPHALPITLPSRATPPSAGPT